MGGPSNERNRVVGEMAYQRLVHSSVSRVVHGVPVHRLEAFDVIGDVSNRKAQQFRGRPITFGTTFVLKAVSALKVGEQYLDDKLQGAGVVVVEGCPGDPAVMLGSEVYAEVIDCHVELGGDVAWIAGLFHSSHPPADARRQKRARSSPAVEIESELGGDWLADRIVVITQLAEELDRNTLELALRIVPVQWWEERLGTSVPNDARRMTLRSADR